MNGITSHRRRVFALGFVSAGVSLVGCSNALEGGATGAGLGALAGLTIGSVLSDPGAGAAIGASIGAVGGAVIGDQNERNARYQSQGPAYGVYPRGQRYEVYEYQIEYGYERAPRCYR